MYKKIGIIGAMQKEIDLIISNMDISKIEKISNFDYYEGRIHDRDVVVVKCGVGKVFAAMCTQIMILTYQPTLIINVGVAGSLIDDLDISDVAIASKSVQYDMDTTAVGDPLGLVSGINKIFFECDSCFIDAIKNSALKLKINNRLGVFATGDSFLSDRKRKQYLIDSFNAIICEMESASIGQVCYVNNVKFGAVRSISDKGDDNSGKDYHESIDKACAILYSVVDEFFESLI